MDSPIDPALLDALRSQPGALIDIILRQARHIEQLLALNSQLLNENTSLRLQVHSLGERARQLEGQNHPPAAPFQRKRSDAPASPPGKPGRKPGHTACWKQPPEHIDEHFEVTLDPHCPHCQGALLAVQPLDQYIEDIIPATKHVTHLRTHQGWCPKCEHVVASTHPRQVSFAGGAAGTHLGARALALACMLKHQMGLSFAKTCEALRELGGISISPGGLAQLFQRVAGKLEADYAASRERLLQSPSVHTDETSWYVGKPGASLCVFCTPQVTHYRVVESKNRATFHEVIAPDWPGVLVSDCLGVYDNATAWQQKCYAHHLKAIKQAEEAGGVMEEGSFLWRCRHLLRTAMAHGKGWEKRAPPQREEELRALKLAAQALLESPIVDRPQEEAVRARLDKQKDHLFVFLERPGVEATNNLAERQLRPAVIARKISCGQRTWEGAWAWQVLASLAASTKQTASSFIELVASRCRVATC
jgi:hypothetical protein